MNESGTAMSPVMVKLPAGFSFLLSLHYAPVKSLQSLPISPLPLETEYEVRSVLMRPLICAAHSAWLLLSLRENIKHMIIGTSQFLFLSLQILHFIFSRTSSTARGMLTPDSQPKISTAVRWTFMVPRGWVLLTLVKAWLFIWHHQQVFLTLKYLSLHDG